MSYCALASPITMFRVPTPLLGHGEPNDPSHRTLSVSNGAFSAWRRPVQTHGFRNDGAGQIAQCVPILFCGLSLFFPVCFPPRGFVCGTTPTSGSTRKRSCLLARSMRLARYARAVPGDHSAAALAPQKALTGRYIIGTALLPLGIETA